MRVLSVMVATTAALAFVDVAAAADAFTCPAKTNSAVMTPAQSGNDRLIVPSSKTSLKMNEKLMSNKGRFYLVLGADGNLVLYDAKKGKGGVDPSAGTWSSNTWQSSKVTSAVATLNPDGKLTVAVNGATRYASTGARFTASQAPITLVVQDDGNMVMWQCGDPYWASNTWVAGAN